MAELQIDMNMKFDFDKICESGKALQTRSGPGYVGLKNMGNTCYLNSVVQVLCALPEIKKRYVDEAAGVFQSTPATSSADDFTCQMSKLAVGLLTEKYSTPEEGAEGACVKPQMFKFLVGKGHSEFSSSNQQDAQEYFLWLLQKMERAERNKTDSDVPIGKLFKFAFEERTVCQQSNKVQYVLSKDAVLSMPIPLDASVNAAEVLSYEERAGKRQKSDGAKDEEAPIKPVIPFEAVVEAFGREIMISAYKSPATKQEGVALRSTRFKTFPKYLVVNLKKYVVSLEWRITKLDVCIVAPESLDLESLRSTGPQPGEELMPDDKEPAEAAACPSADEGMVAQLMGMGFAENGSKRACLATKNASAEAAMEWVFAHMSDANFNDPLEAPAAPGGGGGGGAGVSADSVDMLVSMGFQPKHSAKALKECGGDLERAADWLFSRMDSLDAMDVDEVPVGQAAESGAHPVPNYKAQYKLKGFISHVGSSTFCGHYVCHIKKDDKWTIFNDRKVAISQDPPFDQGYLYFYESVGPV